MGIKYKNFRKKNVETVDVVSTFDKARTTEVEKLPEGLDLPEVKEVSDTMDWKSMSKSELDKYASENAGIELDGRKSKKNMIKELLTKLKGE